jgi:hypothetical protein
MRNVVAMRRTAPQLARAHDVPQPSRERMVDVVERLDDGHARRDRCVAHLPGLDRVRRERLLGQHVLARPDRGQVPRPVQAVGQRVVDDVHLGVGK